MMGTSSTIEFRRRRQVVCLGASDAPCDFGSRPDDEEPCPTREKDDRMASSSSDNYVGAGYVMESASIRSCVEAPGTPATADHFWVAGPWGAVRCHSNAILKSEKTE
jgi:hypothetical protein